MPQPHCDIRGEQPGDQAAIARLLEDAFSGSLEAQLIERLRAAGRLTISLVACEDNEDSSPGEAAPLLGHIAFSPVMLKESPLGLGLAPVAVRPQWQGQGFGAALIRAGLAACREIDCPAVVVLGEPGYYGRFGFAAASQWNLADEFGGGNAFQALELRKGGIPPGGGLVRYSPEFDIFAG